MGRPAVVVEDAKANPEQFATNAIDPNSQARGEGQRVSPDSAKGPESGEPLSGVWENCQVWAKSLCQLCRNRRDRAPCECCTDRAYRFPSSRSPGQRSRDTAPACKIAIFLGTV